MENYQLYRTNVLLGGQIKWDLLLESNSGDLVVSDFHLSPINNRVPYNRHSKDSLLNYSHNENLKKFYKKTSSSFYKDFADPRLTSAWPIICKPGDKLDTHESTYEMGCRRAQYGIYERQFEFFCPLWLEHLKETDTLKFKIDVYTQNSKKKQHVISKFLTLSLKNIKTHDSFIKYFKNYCKYIGIDKGNDNILAVHLNKGAAQISGVNVTNGLPVVKDLPNLVKNLINRERPLIEFDSLLINEFKNNNLIASQLFNFNLCFNINDILTNSLQNQLMGSFFKISTTVYINDEELIKKDFFSNYEYIEKKKCGPTIDDTDINWNFYTHLNNPMPLNNTDLLYNSDPFRKLTSLNVLNYLMDYKCLDIINKNKIVQNIIHWSLYDNNDYIFNSYEGFSGYSNSDDYDSSLKIVHNHLYEDTPNIQQKAYLQPLNNISWCNWVRMSRQENRKLFPSSKLAWLEYSSDFGNRWVNNIKYNGSKNIKLKVLLIKIENEFPSDNPDDISVPPEWLTGKSCEISNGLYFIEADYDDCMFLVSNKHDDLTFISVLNSLNDYIDKNSDADKRLIELRDKMKCADSSNNPPIISLKNSLLINKAKGPSLMTNEIEYYKQDNKPTYVLRYSGKIKPTFISGSETQTGFSNKFNFLYYKDYISDNRRHGESNYQKSEYSIYSNSGLTPLYPSIGYYSIKKLPINAKEFNNNSQYFNFYENPVSVNISEYKKESIPLINSMEYNWYNNGSMLFLYPELSTTLSIDAIERDTLINKIKDYLKNVYLVESNVADYMYGKYKVDSQLEYGDIIDGKIKTYIYNIKLTLK